MSELTKSRGWFILAGATALALFLLLGLRQNHHYDEFGYLYAAAHFTPSEVASGQFAASNVVGFYNGKIGHVIFLKWLVGIFGVGMANIFLMQWIYTALVAATCFFVLFFIFSISVSISCWIGFYRSMGTWAHGRA